MTTPEQSDDFQPLRLALGAMTQMAERFASQPWNPGREVWTPAGVPGPIEEAVARHLEVAPEEWGRANVSGDRSGVAATEVRRAIGRIMARVSSRVYAERDGASGPVVVLEPTATGWPWERDEGDTLCRASALLWQEAERLALGWAKRDEWLERLRDRDGFEPWTKEGDLPALALLILVSAFASRWKREHTVPGLPSGYVSTLLGVSGRTVKWQRGLSPEGESAEKGKGEKGKTLPPSLPRVLVCAATLGPPEWVDEKVAGELASALAVVLCLEAHRQWQRGDEHPESVILPESRDELGKLMNAGAKIATTDLEEALEWLQGVRIGGWPLVNGFERLDRRQLVTLPSYKGTGRPSRYYRVSVGEGLMPWRGVEACMARGFLPGAERFLSPILPLSNVPIIGYNATHHRQRVAWSMAVPAEFVKRREQVLDWGGIEPSHLHARFRELGCYVRTHADLPAKMLAEALKAPAQLTLEGGAGGPWLEQFERNGKTLVRLGPDFGDAWRLIQADGELTKRARAAGLASVDARRVKREKSRGE